MKAAPIAVAFGAIAASSASAQTLPLPDRPVAPAVKEGLAAIMKQQLKMSPMGAANPDPDYSEFWVESKPKPSPSPTPTESRIPKLRIGSLAADTAWSEEVWTEIGPEPDWAEMRPEPPAERTRNTILTMKARVPGVDFGPDFYKNILQSLPSGGQRR